MCAPALIAPALAAVGTAVIARGKAKKAAAAAAAQGYEAGKADSAAELEAANAAAAEQQKPTPPVAPPPPPIQRPQQGRAGNPSQYVDPGFQPNPGIANYLINRQRQR